MKILITGAAGYQAGFVIDRLQPDHELTFFDRVQPQREGRFIAGDITDFDAVREACAGQDAVVHLVALVRERFDKPHGLYADVMVKGTWHVAEACAQNGIRRLVNISSIIAIGWPADTDRPYAVGAPARFGTGDLFYCLAKHLGEEIGRAYSEAHGLQVINLRPGVIAGDGLNPGPERPEGDATDPWFIYVHPEDVAQAVELAVRHDDPPSGSYNVVAGHSDALFDWQATTAALGYQPQHNWEVL
jgi:uronate dehydrogenase